MSIITDILSSILTRGRKIQIKMGLKKDFDDSKLDVGEFGLIIDEDELRIGLADGTTKKVGGVELDDIPVATTSTDGKMSKAMVVKLNSVSIGANFVQVEDSVTSTSKDNAGSANSVKQAYDLAKEAKSIAENNSGGNINLPIASETTLGGVRIGEGLSIDTNGVLSVTGEGNNGGITPSQPTGKIYGVRIDTTNSNPETAVTYINDAVGFTPAKMNFNTDTFSYGSWQDKFPFNQIKPCVLKSDCTVNYYLNPNDYSKKLDDSNADIASGNDGDVMVEFPKIWWKFETVGNYLDIRYSNTQVDNTYKCLAHTKGTTEKDKVYISAYLGFKDSNNKLRSLSGKTPTVNQTIGQFRTQAQANGNGYEQMAYYQLLMLQVLYLVMFKNRDSQSALGRGYVDGNTAATTTGKTNTKGLFYGDSTGRKQIKFCGIEDFYGNCRYWIDGLFSDANRNILIGNQNFNDTGSGYTNFGQGATADLGGYIGTVQGGTETGFIVKVTTGSATTHYADNGYLYASRLPYFGGYWGDADYAGAFYLQVYNSASYTYSSFASRSLAL